MSGTREVTGAGRKWCSHTVIGSRWRIAVTAIVVLTLLVGVFHAFVNSSKAIIGPTGYYTESNGDIIEICSDAACTNHTTTFTPGNTVYLRVTTTRVSNNNNDYLYLRNYANTQVGSLANWNKVSSTSPYVYTAQITIPNPTTTYLKLDASIRRGGNRVDFEQVLTISGVSQSLKTYNDPAYADEADTFRSGAVMYVRGYGSGSAYSSSQTGNNNQLYDFAGSRVMYWSAPTVTQNGNWYDFSLTLPASGLISGDWYMVMTYLRNSGGVTIMRMTRMVLIDDDAPAAVMTSPTPGQYVAGNLAIAGTANDATSFNNYQVEYGAGAAPSSWTQIGSTAYLPVTAGALGSWNTTTVADGLYTLRLTVADRANNTSVSTVQVNVDNNPPVITSVLTSGISSSGATVTWTTNEPADSQVEYGTSPGTYSYSTGLDSTKVTSHSQALAGLQPSTTYYYRVRSADAAGQTTYSTENNFKTANLTVLQVSPGLGLDTYFRSNQPAWNMGKDINLGAGDINGATWGTIRSTLKFDLAGIPSTATISNATMSLYQWWQGDANPQTVNVHYLTGSWTEGTGAGSATGDGATWNTHDGVNAWVAPGGDFNAGVSAGTVAPNATDVWVTWNLTSLTQSWVDGAITNNGLLLKQDVENPAGTDAKGYYSADYTANPNLRPVLTIEWFGNDVTGPTIVDVRAENVGSTTADIKWSTDEASTTQIDYGTTTSYGSTTVLDSTLVNQHSVPLSGLASNTLYHYRVRSIDPSGNETVSGDYTFQTAVQIIIQPDPASGKDASVALGQPGNNSGAWTLALAGDIPFAAWQTTRTLAQFDLSAIPTGSTINSATVSFYQYWQGDTSTPTLDLHYLTRSWTEGTGTMTATNDGASWNSYDGTNPWGTPGGDYNAAASASAVAPNSTSSWVDWDVTGLTQGWVDGSVVNNGFVIKKNVETGAVFDSKGFYTSDYMGDPSLRPKLVIEYTPPPGSITLTVDETYNRDGTSGGGSVGFGLLSTGTTYYVGDTASPQYAVQLTVQSNINWGLKVAASGDLVHTVNPANTIGIANLSWKIDGGGVYAPFVKLPAEDTILSGQGPTAGTPLRYDYQFIVPVSAVSGNYSTSIAYTAYTE